MHKHYFRIIASLIFVLIGGWATIQKDIITEEKDKIAEDQKEIKERAFQAELLKRDSISDQKMEDRNTNYIEILAKYNLHYDSANNEVRKLVFDSMRTEEIPFLQMCKGKIEDYYANNIDSIRFNFQICNYSNVPAYNIYIKTRCIKKKNGKYYQIGASNDLFSTRPSVASNRILSKLVTIYSPINKTIDVDTIFIVIKGDYTNYKRTVKKKFEEVDYLNLANKNWVEYEYKREPLLYEFIKENHLMD